MRIKIWLFIGVAIITVSFIVEDPLKKRIISSLEAYTRTFPQEKAYLHVDKPYYHAGDTIWIKAYLVDAQHNFPDSASGVLYVDLIDNEYNKLISRKTLKVTTGYALGNIELPFNLHDGNYRIRAYTNWMRNFAESSFFTKNIKIYSGDASSQEKILPITEIQELFFFPEGGDIVADLQNRIAFKAVNIFGQGVDVSGYVLNVKKDTVTTFKSVHLGMGYFSFTPSANESYLVYAKDSKGIIKPFGLPKVQQKGFTMAIDNLSKRDELKIYISHNYGEKKHITVIGHQRGTPCYAAEIQEANGVSLLKVPLLNFTEDGIVQFTLFDEAGRPVCERIVYVSLGDDFIEQLLIDKPKYKTNEKVTMTFNVTDADGAPVEGNFSLSVTDESQITHDKYSETISSYFLLTSDAIFRQHIQGTIEQPGFYFDKSNTKAKAYLDILLMTQGWRRFTWNDVLVKTSYDTTFRVEPGLTLTGNVTQPNGRVSKERIKPSFMISAKDQAPQVVEGEAYIDGKYYASNMSFTDSVEITAIQPNKEKKMKFTFDALTYPSIEAVIDYPEATWAESTVVENYLQHEKQIIDSRRSTMLKEIVVTAKKETKIDPRRIMLQNPVSASVLKVNASNCASSVNAFQLLQGRVPGVTVRLVGTEYSAFIRGATSFSPTQPLYLLDGIVVQKETINAISACDLETVEVYRTPNVLFGSKSSGGIIAFFLRNADSPPMDDPANPIYSVTRMGFSNTREFYSPKYKINEPKINDYRSTVYWNPMVITGSNGKATVHFWSSSATGKMRATLEGLSYKGKPVSITTTYSVE